MKKILCIFFCLLPILGGKAQTLYKDQVRIEKESITRSEDNNVLTINLDIVLKENLKLESNNVATLKKHVLRRLFYPPPLPLSRNVEKWITLSSDIPAH